MSAAIKKSVALSSVSVLIGTASAFGSSPVTIGAYAVANHSSCGAGNIPGTIAELDKFFDSADFTSDFQKNFYWKDTRVKQTEWIKDGDYRASSETTSGYDGSDASLLTYIASHGVTSGGVYKALAGSRGNGGCYIPTSGLELGNQGSRYTILSTCQGLKIGTGDNPSATGENPSRTWKNAAKGLNCILGYSNNMADADQYGEYLLANIKDGTTSLSKAFMDASESVSTDNIPAVLCFGSSEQDAADYIENNTQFESQARANNASAWVFRVVSARSIDGATKTSIPAALRLSAKPMNVEKVATVFLGSALTKTNQGRTRVFSASSGSVKYDTVLGTLTVTNNLIDDVKNESVPSAAEAEQIAWHALKVSGLLKSAGNLSLAATSEDKLGGESGVQKVLARKFTFKQNLAGSTSLSQQGAIDVTIGAAGAITSIKSALVEIDSGFKTANRSTDISARFDDIENQAIQHVAAKAPGANYRIIKHRVGYDAGNFHKSNRVAPAVIEVTVEAAQGEFKRNFVEKFAL